MADQYNYDSTQPVRSQASATYTPTGLNDQDNLNAYNANREQQISNVYDKALASTQQGMKTAYDQNMSDLQAARDKITPQYQQSANALAAEYERQKRNTNMQGAANGLNTGAGSQLALGQSMAYQGNAGNLARSQNEALNEANRSIADLGVKYQNEIAQAVANNDYKLAASMLDEYENQYNRQRTLEDQNYQRALQAEQQAYQRAYNEENRDYERAYNLENRDFTRAWNQDERDYTRDWNYDERTYDRTMTEAANRAEYGDFSGYAAIYGQDIANAMRDIWVAQNPLVAYSTGAISADEYMMLTGKYPYNYGNSSGSSGYSSYGRSGGGGGRGYGSSSSGTDTSADAGGADITFNGVVNALAAGYNLNEIKAASANPQLAEKLYDTAVYGASKIAPASGGSRSVGGALQRAAAATTNQPAQQVSTAAVQAVQNKNNNTGLLNGNKR